MASDASVDDVIQVRTICYAPGPQAQGIMVRHWRVSSVTVVGPGAGGLLVPDLLLLMDARERTDLPPILATGATYYGLQGRRYLFATPPVWTVAPGGSFDQPTLGGPLIGASVGHLMSPATCGLVKWQTSLGGRRGRGRSYLPFPSEGDNLDGLPSGAYPTLAGAYGANMLIPFSGVSVNDPLTTSTWQVRLCIVPGNLSLGGVTTPPYEPPYVVARTVRSVWATQRRRGGFRGPDPVPILI